MNDAGIYTSAKRILRWPDLQNAVGMSRSHVHLLIRQDKFPPPIKLGPQASGWISTEIDFLLELRTAKSRLSGKELTAKTPEFIERSQSQFGDVPKWVTNSIGIKSGQEKNTGAAA